MLTFDEIKGKTILVGITYVENEKSGKIKGRKQFYGTITGAGVIGIKIRCHNGKDISLPPDLNAIRPAPKGNYRLFSTGEAVESPDFISTWRVTLDESNA
ncbi:MAG: hypothetical protein LUI05_08490 [Oscillospiraceae bacterium]|nr:hypothetical protein [Oscillospiraceae bacterium]